VDESKVTIPLVQAQPIEVEQAVLEKLPLGDTDLIKEGIERSPQACFFQSPTNITGGNLFYSSPISIGVTFPFAGMGSMGGSPRFRGPIDFSSFIHAGSAQTGTSLNLPNSIFGSDNCSPCLFQTNLTPRNDYFCKADDKDN
jgi:hypothetical protein